MVNVYLQYILLVFVHIEKQIKISKFPFSDLSWKCFESKGIDV